MATSIPNALLSEYTTFRLGGPCRSLILCETPDDLVAAVRALSASKEPFILIGGGSNLVVSQHGLDVHVIRYWSDTPRIERDGHDLVVSGSTVLDHLALYAVDQGLSGLNYTTGIPGTVGGAVVGNAGAWGKQVGDVLTEATLLKSDGSLVTVTPDALEFRYRHSLLKETNDIVVSARFSLEPGDPVTLAKERADILQQRAEKHPDLSREPCAGSFFRNVEPTSKADRRQAAGWFLEEAGANDFTVGGARLFSRHANIIIKATEICTAQDVHDLSKAMQAAVKQKFSLDLVREVRFVGPLNSSDSVNPAGFW